MPSDREPHAPPSDAARYADALALYGRNIHPGPAQFALTLLDATALLWRLHLEGVDVGGRFERVADEWEARLDQDRAFYAFNDMHAILAFVATQRTPAIERLTANLAESSQGSDANAAMSREVGIPVAQGILAFGSGRYATLRRSSTWRPCGRSRIASAAVTRNAT